MTTERLFLLCGVSSGGDISAGWLAICERCLALDGPEALRIYRHVCELAPRLRECGVGDEYTLVVHHDGVEVRHGPEADIRALAFLPWKCRVDYRLADEPAYSWH